MTRPLALIGAALAGVLVFLSLAGTAPLMPGNIAWLREGDMAQYYLGWSFFRATPWGWPPGANPAYGMELAAGIFYADMIPLFALPMKLFAPAEGPFQYFGWWLLTCFVLQAVFAARLLALWVPSVLGQVLAAALFCMMPMLWMRAVGHFALTAHWLILAALWLNLAPGVPPRRGLTWMLLAFAAALVHAYLLVMVLALWLADLARRVILVRPALRMLALEAGGVALAVALAFFLAGVFLGAGGSASAWGFGLFRANLATLVDSGGWSRILPDIPGGPGDYEGFAFLGVGGLGLLALALLGALARAPRLRGRWWLAPWPWWPLIGLILAFSLFALSNRVALGPWELGRIRLPGPVSDMAGVLRSSGRFIWPLAYLLLLWGVVSALRLRPALLGVGLLAAAVAAQAVDLTTVRRNISANYTPVGPSVATPLTNPFWREAALRHGAIRHIPPGNVTPHWAALSGLALAAGVPTDAIYLGRVSDAALSGLRARAETALLSGRFPEDALYVLDQGAACLAAATLDPRTDLLARLDGLVVLAPGWLRHAAAPAEAEILRPESFPAPPLAPGVPVPLMAGGATTALCGGWHPPNADVSWSLHRTAVLRLGLAEWPRAPFTLRLDAQSNLGRSPHVVEVATTRGVVARWTHERTGNRGERDIALLPEDVVEEGGQPVLRLWFRAPDGEGPLGLGVARITLLE